MKKYCSILCMTLCLGLMTVFAGCNDNEADDVLPAINLDEIDYSFTESDMFYQLPKGIKEKTFDFKTRANWTVRLSNPEIKDLFEISKTAGNGDGSIRIALKKGAQIPLYIGLVFTFTSDKVSTKSTTIEVQKYLMASPDELAIGEGDVVNDVLGRGYDIFADLNAANVKGIVFDTRKLNAKNKLEKLTGGFNATNTQVSGKSYNETNTAWSTGMNGTFSTIKLMGLLASPFQATLNGMLQGSTTTKETREFAVTSLAAIVTRRQINDNYILTVNDVVEPGESQSQNDAARDSVLQYLTVEAANAINGDVSFKKIFDLYGTHVITAAQFGGRYDYVFAREKGEYLSSAAQSAGFGLSKRIGKKMLKNYQINADVNYTHNDSVSFYQDGNIVKERRMGGSSTSSLDEWLEKLPTSATEDLAMIGLIFNNSDDNRGLLPIYQLCKDATRRNAMKEAWETYIEENAIYMTEARRILADVMIVNARDGSQELKQLTGFDGQTRVYKRGLMVSAINNDKYVDSENYFYYVMGYDDNPNIGFTDIIIKHRGEGAGENFTARGATSTDGITGVPTQHNRLYIKRRTDTTASTDLITGLKWVQGDTAATTESANAGLQWIKTTGEEWLAAVGRPHTDLFLYYTKATLP